MAARKKKAEPEWPATEIVRRKVDELIPYARNSREHSKQQVAKIAASIREWGWTNPVLIGEDDDVIAGHGRLMAAEMLSIPEVPCIVAKGWSEAQKRAYVIADNQLALDASWNREMLKVELGELAELDFDLGLTGFDDLELKGLLQGEFDFGEGYEKTIDKPKDPIAKSGDVWILGNHRLMCGDSTDENAVAMLLDGAKPRLMVTDPPYGVDYDPQWRADDPKVGAKSVGKVVADTRVDWSDAYKLFGGDVAYVWHSARFAAEVAKSLEVAGFEIRAQIIWAKNRSPISRGHYHWGHEPCWYSVRKGKKAHWIGDRTQSTLWKIAISDDGDETGHSTQKPIECMGRPLRNHDSDDVYEPFSGSGTTIVACELVQKRCLAMEIDPGYVDVAIQRWQDRTGCKAMRESDGAEYDTLAAQRTVAEEA